MSKPKTVAEIREAFLSFFEAKQHLRLDSDSLIPSNDPTLLFTGAGMNQFKDEFLGKGRSMKRATTSQKCIRVPDLENVGATPRHHTFFEMLGNFSFGDYFKKETISWEWEFFTEVLGWPAEQFVVTVYEEDDEAFEIWNKDIGLGKDRIYRFGEKENFWPASAPSKGPNGVCGPCSEIYFDTTPGLPLPDNQGMEELPDRFVEVGNCVFTQFEREDGGVLAALPHKNIDVGLGLERLAAIAQGVPNNFETDMFAPCLSELESITSISYETDSENGIRMRRIADHSRAVFFCIADGVVPAREGRGYVVRKILRRAIRDAIEMGVEEVFLSKLLKTFQITMGECYPEIIEQEDTIKALVDGEEKRFREVYSVGIARLKEEIEAIKLKGEEKFSGETAFELHDTFGFPLDTTTVIAQEAGLAVDVGEFEKAMELQKARARAGSSMSGDVFAQSLPSLLEESGVLRTNFVGYSELKLTTVIVGLVKDNKELENCQVGEECEMILKETPFYAEGGGQVGDSGLLSVDGEPIFEVRDTTEVDGYYLHHGKVLKAFDKQTVIEAVIDKKRREQIERHHSATHLLHAAMKKTLGKHINQAGSRVNEHSLRFDYTHPEALTKDLMAQIETEVNEQILSAFPIETNYTSLAAAKESGVTALFGEKYGTEVRVVNIDEFSKELCGGCHAKNSGSIGYFRILSDKALSAGVRRMEAVTGLLAIQLAKKEQTHLAEVEFELKAPAGGALDKIKALKNEVKTAKNTMKVELPSSEDVLQSLDMEKKCMAWKHLAGIKGNDLRKVADSLKKNLNHDLIVLTGGDAEEMTFCVLVGANEKAHAGDIAKEIGKSISGGGGGRSDFAQGKGRNNGDFESVIEKIFGKISS